MRRQIKTGRLAGLALIGAAFAAPATAEDGRPFVFLPQEAQLDLERPGGAPPPAQRAIPSPPTDNPGAIAPPPSNLRFESVPVPDRWRILDGITPARSQLDPYNQNTLKGDKPLFDDWFLNLSAISDSVIEPRTVPVPVGVAATSRPGSNDTFGRPRQLGLVENVILSASLRKGDTNFKPPDYEFRFTPVLNGNYTRVEEVGILKADPGEGKVRRDSFIGIQDLFAEKHLFNLSERYDFLALRGGIQPFQADFRGFLFQDNPVGLRLFGNLMNNQLQYNLAWFKQIEKDTNSGLNDLSQPLRNDNIYVANLYYQDFPVKGFTLQGTVLHNRNDETEFHYDQNGFLVRPASLASEVPRKYSVTYLGLNGDGHFGWLNLTASAYYAFGRDQDNPFTGDPAKIRGSFFALEPSVDFDWIRVRGSFLRASGDKDPYDNREGGFDAVFENPQFAGGDTSYWIRQGIPFIGGGGVALTHRNSVLPSLRSSKEEGQSNFINPGLLLFGGGMDFDLLPELRLSTNLNYLRFENTKVLEVLRNQGDIDKTIGWDLSAAITWRPLQIQNVVMRLSGAVLFAGQGMKDLYGADGGGADRYYSVLGNLVLTY